MTLIGGYIFALRRNDRVSPPSVLGGAWLRTDNGTNAWAGEAEFYFKKNRYHVLSGFAHGDLYYDFYGIGNAAGDAGRKFGLKQTGDIFFSEALRRFFWQTFIGPRIWWGSSQLAPQHIGENFPNLPPLEVTLVMRALGFKVERQTMRNRFYPTQGSSTQLSSDFFAKDFGSTFTFQRYVLILNQYRSLNQKQVVATNLYACYTGGNAPFFGQCIFGMMNELRGYPAGRYIDRRMLAAQGEYRLSLPWHLGIAAFGGAGEVAPTVSSFNARNLLPSVGAGPRFELSKKYHVNIRADFAWGKNGRTFSMGLGEAF